MCEAKGWHHRYVMNGADLLHSRFSSAACSIKIISAGFGLVDEGQWQPLVRRSAHSLRGLGPGIVRKRY